MAVPVAGKVLLDTNVFIEYLRAGLYPEWVFGRVSNTIEGAWRRVARARAQVPRSAARRVPVSGWAAQSPAAGGRQRGV